MVDRHRTGHPPGRTVARGRPAAPRALVGCAVVAVTEAVVVARWGPPAALALVPQVTAPAPLGAFHDLRWLAVYHSRWWTFAAELAALVVFRATLDALIVGWVWPPDRRPRSFADRVRRTSGVTAFAVVALTPWVIVLFGLAVAPISWLFLVGLPPALVVAGLVHHGAVVDRWWATLPVARSVGWMLVAAVAATVAGAIIRMVPTGAGVAVAGAAGAANALIWRRVVVALTDRQGRSVVAGLVPAAALGLTGVVLAGAAAGFGAQTPPTAPNRTPGAVATAGPQVLVIAGFGTHWDGVRAPPAIAGYRTELFSYRGLDSSGRPLPYGADDTKGALAVLERRLAAQVDSLSAQTGAPVRLVAVSEGALIAKGYLAGAAEAPVSDLVMVSPLAEPGRVYYPPSGREGWGLVTGWGLSAVTGGIRAVSDIDVTPSSPLFRSIVDRGPGLRATMAAPLRGVRLAAVLPLADAVAEPDAVFASGASVVVVPGFHNGSLGDPRIGALVADLLAGRQVSRSWSGVDLAVRRAAAAWQVPALNPSLNPAWRAVG